MDTNRIRAQARTQTATSRVTVRVGGGASGQPPDLRQPRHPQDPAIKACSGIRASTCTSLRPDPVGPTRSNAGSGLLAHRRHYPQRSPYKCPGPRSRHLILGRSLERQPETLHLDQDRAADPESLGDFINGSQARTLGPGIQRHGNDVEVQQLELTGWRFEGHERDAVLGGERVGPGVPHRLRQRPTPERASRGV
jgi:hypothetical protein